MLGSTIQHTSNHNGAMVQPPTQATITNMEHQSIHQPFTMTTSTDIRTYTALRKVKDHKPEYVKSIVVLEWPNLTFRRV